MGLLDAGNGDAITSWLARMMLAEDAAPAGQAAPRSAEEDRRVAMSGLLSAAGSLANSPAMQWSTLPQNPVGAFVNALGAGFQGAAQQNQIEFAAQAQELQRQQLLREQQRRQALRGMLGAYAVGGLQQPAGMAPAGGPAPADATPIAVEQLPELGPLSAESALRLPNIGRIQERYRPAFVQAVTQAGLTPEQANAYARMVGVESGGRHDTDAGGVVTSRAGALGIAQVMPGTFREVAERYGINGPITDPAANLAAGARYFREQLDAFGNVRDAAGAYNAGPRRYRDSLEGGAQLPAETRRYLTLVTGQAGAGQPPAAVVDGFARATGTSPAQAQTLLGLTPAEAMLLLLLPDAQLSQTLGSIMTERAKGAGRGVELIPVAEARALGLPNPDSTRYQRQAGGDSAGRISEVGGGGTTTRVTIDQRGADRLQAMDVERIGKAREAVDGQAALIPQLETIRTTLLGGADTGAWTAALAGVGSYLEAAGILGKDQGRRLNEARLLQSLIAQIVPNMRPVGAGSTSDRDLALFQQAAPRLMASPVGNLLITGAMLQLRQARAEEVDRMEAWARQRNGSLEGWAAEARKAPALAFPRLTDDDAGEQLRRTAQAGTVLLLPNGALGVLLPDGRVDDGTGRAYTAWRATLGRR